MAVLSRLINSSLFKTDANEKVTGSQFKVSQQKNLVNTIAPESLKVFEPKLIQISPPNGTRND